MKYVLIVAAVIVGVVLTMLVLTIFTHIFDNHERAGQFDIYTNPKVPDSSVHSALYYKRHRLTERLNSYSVDPNNVDRILFSSDDVFHGSEGLCGTFLYDGQSGKLTPLRPWPHGGGLWSPDSRFILLNRATVRELLTGEEVDLMDSISREDGSRVELSILQWSPDSQRLAGVIRISPDGRDLDLDLVEIRLAPLSVKYHRDHQPFLAGVDAERNPLERQRIAGRGSQYNRARDHRETAAGSRLDNQSAECSCQTSAVRTFLFSGRGQIELNARRRISASLAFRHVRSTRAYQTADLGLDCETTV
jgi:hypothetical protein